MRRSTGSKAWVRWLAVPWAESTLALTLVSAAAVPVFLVASASVWRAAAEDDITARTVEFEPLDRNGLDIIQETTFDTEGVEVADRELRVEVDRIAPLAEPDRSLYTLPGLVTIGPPVRQVGPTGRLFAREGALDAIDVVAQAASTSGGVWITTWFAERHGLGLGDGLAFEAGAIADEQWNDIVQGGGTSSVFRIVGLYEPLWSRDPNAALDPYWQTVPPEVVPRFIGAFNGPSSELVIIDERTLTESGLTGVIRWRAPLVAIPGTFDELRRLRNQMAQLELELVSAGQVGSAMSRIATSAGGRPRLDTDLDDVTGEVVRATRRLAGPLESARAVGTSIGLAGMLAVGVFFVERRRTEFRLLAGEGEQWATMAGRVAVQLLAPVVVGAALGVVGAIVGLRWLGPAVRIDIGSVPWRVVAAIAVASWLLAAVAAGIAGARTLRRPIAGVAKAVSAALVSMLTLGTLFTWVQIGRTATSADVDVAVVALPVLAVLLVVTVALAAAGVGLRLTGSVSGRLPVAGFLALRRLATGATRLRVVAGSVGLGVGLLVFAVALTSTLDRTVDVKLATELGGESTLTLLDDLSNDVDLPPNTTLVRTFDTLLTPGRGRARVIAVDTTTWVDAVTWPSSFGSNPDEVLRLLDRSLDGALPAVAVEGEPAPAVGAFGLTRTYGYEIVARVASLPGAGASASTLLVSADAVDRMALEEAGYETVQEATSDGFRVPTQQFRRRLVSQAPALELVTAMDAAGIAHRDVNSRAARSRAPGVLAARSAFGYLGVLGVAAALAALVALGLYLSGRQRTRALATVMTTSMGLSRVHVAIVTVIEFVVVLSVAIAAAFAAVPLVVRRLSSRFDPDPALPPDVAVSIDWLLLFALAGASMLFVGLVVFWIEWSGGRRSAGEVLRDVG